MGLPALQILSRVVGGHLLAGVAEAVLPVHLMHFLPVGLRCEIAAKSVPAEAGNARFLTRRH